MTDDKAIIKLGPFTLAPTKHGAPPSGAMDNQLVWDLMYELTINTPSGPYRHTFDIALVSFLESLAGSLIGTLTRNSDDESRILLMDYCEMVYVKVCGSKALMSIDGTLELEALDYVPFLALTLNALKKQTLRAVSEGRTKDRLQYHYRLSVDLWHYPHSVLEIREVEKVKTRQN
jgi:hypothetical protein